MEQPKSKLHWEKQKEEQVKRKTLLWFLWLSSARLSCHFSHFGCLIKTYFLMNTCFVVKYVRNFILLCSARGNVNRICKIEIAEYPHSAGSLSHYDTLRSSVQVPLRHSFGHIWLSLQYLLSPNEEQKNEIL